LSPQLDAARALHDEIGTYSASAEENCHVDPALIQRLCQEGLFATPLPEHLGGSQLAPLETMKLLESLSYSDSAVGWCAMIYTTTAMLGSFLPEDWAKTVYGPTEQQGGIHRPISCGAAAPNGRARIVDGGVEVTGRWQWGSGSHNADWISGGTLIEEPGSQDGDNIRRSPEGAPLVHIMFFEKEAVTLHNNWNPSGLRGTGSVDFEVKNLFVPEGRWTVLGQSRRQIDGPLYRFPFFGYFASAVAAVPLGIARRAVDDFVDIAQGKTPLLSNTRLSESEICQLDFARAESLVAGAHHYVYGALNALWEKIESGERATMEDRRQLRLAASQATIMSAEAVDLLYNAAGGSSLQGDCSLQKHFRDIHAATQHKMVSPDLLKLSGAARLSNGPAFPNL